MPTPRIIPITDVDQIDLDRHGLIEASAGTGKTYTIENMVVRLLMEKPDLGLENILLVTFTEKATCELKSRIREKIEQVRALPDVPPAAAARLAIARDTFDTAPIHTIHGFCHTILTNFAFETDALFQTDQVDDRPLIQQALQAQLRTGWPARYGPLLPQLLKISDFPRKKTGLTDTLVNIVASGFYPPAGDRLHPDPHDADIGALIDSFTRAMAALTPLAGPAAGFADAYQSLNFHATRRKSILTKILRPLEKWLPAWDPARPDLAGFADLLDTMNSYLPFKQSGPAIIRPQKYNRGGDNSEKVCPHLDDVIAALTAAIRTFISLKYIVAAESILRLGTAVETIKATHGWISYGDMLKQVHTALTGPRAGRLRDTLRRQYRYAFVDEFQDTDPIQWQIFASLFLSDDTCRLFLIGDPKQAIYSFRGADVFTYLSARRQLQYLAGRGRAALYSLSVNWRSAPALVRGFNRLFATDAWFGPPENRKWDEIAYRPAASPETDALPETIHQDTSGRSALNFIDLRGADRTSQAAMNLARFIAGEIRFLTSGERIRITQANAAPRALDPGDICVLVRSRANAFLIEKELASRRIPCSYYQKPGLFASDEAYYLSVVLHAIARPADSSRVKMALLTPFFQFEPDDLYACDDLPATHPVRRLFLNWRQLALYRRWGELFHSLLIDSGLAFRAAATPEWDRIQANYQQLFASLGARAHRDNLDFDRVCALLDGFRRQTIRTDGDADIHEIETEKRKVQIITMHRAKGLQFPVVFIAGGLTQKSSTAYHCFHRMDSDSPGTACRIFDLTRTADPARHQQEATDEDKRLLYVALTRAQFKLYIPFFPATSQRAHFGPVCRFMARAVKEAFADPAGAREAAWLSPETAVSAPVAREIPEKSARLRELPTRRLPAANGFTRRTARVASFSSIHADAHKTDDAALPGIRFDTDRDRLREDDESTAADAPGIAPATRPADEIPGGRDVGLMFHAVFEHIDFRAVRARPRHLLDDPGPRDLIRREMARYGVDAGLAPQVARVVADTLTTPVPPLGNRFSLGMLAAGNRRHEIGFYYTIDNHPNRLIRGVVDLVFRWRDVYYIADWKSNVLADGYGPDALAANMDAAGYRLQYRLYTVAVYRWLKQVLGDRFDPRRHFGGVFYFYLRGMGAGPGQGICFVPPEDIGPVTTLETTLANHV